MDFFTPLAQAVFNVASVTAEQRRTAKVAFFDAVARTEVHPHRLTETDISHVVGSVVGQFADHAKNAWERVEEITRVWAAWIKTQDVEPLPIVDG